MTTLVTYVFLSTALPLSFLCLLHTSTPASDLFLKAIPFCCVGCHSSYTETFTSMNSMARPLCWFGVCPQEGNKRLLAELVETQIKPRQFTASAPAVLSLCENHTGVNPDATGAHFVHWVPILPSFSLLPKSKGTGGGVEGSHSEWSNGVTAETKIIHSLALMFGFEFLFKIWIIL